LFNRRAPDLAFGADRLSTCVLLRDAVLNKYLREYKIEKLILDQWGKNLQMESDPQFEFSLEQPGARPGSRLTPHDIEAALNEATKAEPELGTVTLLEDSSWLIELTNGDDILAQWATDPPRLVLMATLARPEAEQELQAYKAALSYNAHWHQNGSLRIARDQDQGDLLLITDLLEARLTAHLLAEDLMRFEAFRTIWRLAIGGIKNSDTTLPSEDDAVGMRV
jgi:hypothetical protein